jgi:hypothetical protein
MSRLVGWRMVEARPLLSVGAGNFRKRRSITSYDQDGLTGAT